MNPMHQPIKINTVSHDLTIEGTDVEVTRFIEYMENEWFTSWNNLMNFSEVEFNLGYDTLTFKTTGAKKNIIKHIAPISRRFDSMLMVYEYMDLDSYEEGSFFLLGGNITVDKDDAYQLIEQEAYYD